MRIVEISFHVIGNMTVVRKTINDSLYTRPFKVLKFFGAWELDNTTSSIKKQLFRGYQILQIQMTVYALLCMYADFFEVLGDLKSMSFNLCFSIIFTAMLSKLYYLNHRAKEMNQLQQKLHRAFECRSSPRDIEIEEASLKEFKVIYLVMAGGMGFCLVVAYIVLYFNPPKGENTFPLPLKIPIDLDYSDALQLNISFLVIAVLATNTFIIIIEQEIGMFAFMIQISREYDVLIKDIPQLNEIYDTETRIKGESKTEINPVLLKIRTKTLLTHLSQQQQTITE